MADKGLRVPPCFYAYDDDEDDDWSHAYVDEEAFNELYLAFCDLSNIVSELVFYCAFNGVLLEEPTAISKSYDSLEEHMGKLRSMLD